MDFSSIPAYLDPSNWQQQPNPQPGGGSSGNSQLPPQPPLPPPPHAGVGVGSIRPGSMADRARMANIPMPEAALKCPRCESTSTKFCYFNNYNLTQPRHFCKTCRRYWTRGGALRNVPVGGGCRRNKRSNKGSNSSKSPINSSDQHTRGGSSTNTSILGLPPPQHALSQLTEIGVGDIGLNYGGIAATLMVTGGMNFQLPSISLGGGGTGGSHISAGSREQWRLQQPPSISSFAGLDLPAGLYPFQGGLEPSGGYVGEGTSDQVGPKLPTSVKMEESYKEMNLSRLLLGIQGSDQYWNGSTTTTAWTDLSGFSSSSTSNLL